MNLFGQSNQKLFPEVEKQSFNVTQERIEKLKELFPNIVSDGKIDWKTLKLMLGENITEEDERYRFTWNGKTKAIQEVGIPTTSTLRPDKYSSKDWNTTENLYIEGDNLEVLKVLQNSYNGKIKIIYIDPPYNTGSDFIYKDDFALSVEEVEKQEGLKDRKGVIKTVDKLTKNSKDSAKYHTNWLNMMYPRLSIARDLLTEDGVIFISIGQEELNNLITISNEIFGESNIQGIISRQMKTGGNQGKAFSKNIDYILVYAKDSLKVLPFREKLDDELKEKVYNKIQTTGNRKGEYYRLMGLYQAGLNDLRPNQKYFIKCPDGSEVIPPCRQLNEIMEEGDGRWRWTKTRFLEELSLGNVEFVKTKTSPLIDKDGNPSIWNIYTKIWLSDREEEGKIPTDFMDKVENRHSSLELKRLDIPFDFAKPSNLVRKLVSYVQNNKDSIILDFFSGSATTADAVMQLNSEDNGSRKFIMVQVPELSYEGKKDKDGNYIINEKTRLPEIQKDSEARKNGFNYITEIGKTRIKRAAKKILDENKDKDLSKLDIGFKTFKIDSSNFNEWDTSYEALEKAIKESSEGKFATYKQDRTDLDLVYEIMLKEGLFLTENVEEIKMNAGTLYKIAEGVMYIFLKKLDKEVVKKIIDLKIEAQGLLGLDNPTVVLNEAYLDTELKANAKKNFEVNGIVNIKTL